MYFLFLKASLGSWGQLVGLEAMDDNDWETWGPQRLQDKLDSFKTAFAKKPKPESSVCDAVVWLGENQTSGSNTLYKNLERVRKKAIWLAWQRYVENKKENPDTVWKLPEDRALTRKDTAGSLSAASASCSSNPPRNERSPRSMATFQALNEQVKNLKAVASALTKTNQQQEGTVRKLTAKVEWLEKILKSKERTLAELARTSPDALRQARVLVRDAQKEKADALEVKAQLQKIKKQGLSQKALKKRLESSQKNEHEARARAEALEHELAALDEEEEEYEEGSAVWDASASVKSHQCGRYPPEVVFMYMELLSRDALPSQASNLVRAVLRVFCPEEAEEFYLPNPSTVGRWRQALLPMSNLVSGVMIASAERLTLHTDGTTLSQQKLACAPINIVGGRHDGCVALGGGVYTQGCGSSVESAKHAMQQGVQIPLQAVKRYREFVSKPEKVPVAFDSLDAPYQPRGAVQGGMGNPPSWLPSSSDCEVLTRIVSGELSISVMGDHASTQKKLTKILEDEFQLLREETKEADGELNDGSIIIDVYCYDHKRTNVAGWFGKGDQKVLSALGDGDDGDGDPDNNIFGDNIVTQLIRMSGKEFGHHRLHAYEFGQGVSTFKHWMEVMHPGKWMGMRPVVGSRNDVYFENAMIAFYMAEYYLGFLM